ncbi:MAG: hypothetical protein ACI9SC_002255 [Gammaproteobacteria bacterium]
MASLAEGRVNNSEAVDVGSSIAFGSASFSPRIFKMQSTLKDIFHEELKLCEVGPGQTIAVLSEGDLLRDYAEYSLSAAHSVPMSLMQI